MFLCPACAPDDETFTNRKAITVIREIVVACITPKGGGNLPTSVQDLTEFRTLVAGNFTIKTTRCRGVNLSPKGSNLFKDLKMERGAIKKVGKHDRWTLFVEKPDENIVSTIMSVCALFGDV